MGSHGGHDPPGYDPSGCWGIPPGGMMGYGYPGYGMAPGWNAWASQAAQAYGMMQGYGYGVAAQFGAAAMHGGGGARPSASAAPSERSNVGKKGDYASMLDEIKASQSARAALREEREELKGRLERCSGRDRGRLGELQHELAVVEQRLGELEGHGRDRGSALVAHAGDDRWNFRPPEDGSTDQFGRLCHVLAGLLQACEGRAGPVRSLAEERRVQQEWSDLARSRLVAPSTQLEDVLVERPELFEVFDGADEQPHVRLLAEVGGRRHLSSGSGDGRPSKAARTSQRGLHPEKVREIEEYMKKAGGSERVSRLGTLFGVDEVQLSRHFCLYEDRGRTYATPGQSPADKREKPQSAPGAAELQGLEGLLQRLRPARGPVCEAMAFCLDRSGHAAQLARCMVRALEEPDLDTDMVLARFFLVSDVLHNANSSGAGAAKYRASFQELLPDACERLGRCWLRRIQAVLEEGRARAALRRVLDAWVEWAVFPPLFARGLEALLFAAVAEAAPAADAEADADLRRKLARWCAAADAARLPYAARMRGLSGSALATAACRARLCHYERYWHRPGADAPGPAEEDWGEDLRHAPAARLEAPLDACAGAAIEDDIDGESMSEGELEYESEAAASQSAVGSRVPLRGHV